MRRLLVRRLRALVLALDDDPGREVRDPDGRVGLVHVLAAGAARAVGVDPQVGLVDLDRGVVGQERADDHLRERRVAAMRRVERREADEPVDAALGLEARRRRSRRATVKVADLRPASSPGLASSSSVWNPRRSAQRRYMRSEDLRPVLGSRCRRRPAWIVTTASPAVVLAVEERVLLEPVQLGAQRREAGGDLVGHVAVHLGQLARVVGTPGRAAGSARAASSRASARCEISRRVLLVVPEAGRAHRFLELGGAGR